MWLRSPRRTQYPSASQARKPATRVASASCSAINSWLRSVLYGRQNGVVDVVLP
jgi:hypothetical protein